MSSQTLLSSHQLLAEKKPEKKTLQVVQVRSRGLMRRMAHSLLASFSVRWIRHNPQPTNTRERYGLGIQRDMARAEGVPGRSQVSVRVQQEDVQH